MLMSESEKKFWMECFKVGIETWLAWKRAETLLPVVYDKEGEKVDGGYIMAYAREFANCALAELPDTKP